MSKILFYDISTGVGPRGVGSGVGVGGTNHLIKDVIMSIIQNFGKTQVLIYQLVLTVDPGPCLNFIVLEDTIFYFAKIL